MNKKDTALFNEYTLNLQSKVYNIQTKPEINKSVMYSELANCKLPKYISEEVFDRLVETLKEYLINEGILLSKPSDIHPCENCCLKGSGMCYTSPCDKLKQYNQQKEKYKELFGE